MSHPKIDQQVTFLSTTDLNKTVHFFEEILGFDLVLDQGVCRIYRISNEGFLGFCEREECDPESSGVIYTFVTPKVDEWYQFLIEKGVEIDKLPSHNPTYNIYHFFFKDPTGYTFEVQEFLDPAWPK